MKYDQFFLAVCMVVMLARIPVAQAAEVTLSWELPKMSPAIAGLRIYWGVKRGHYTQHLDVGKHQTTVTIPQLQAGTIYYFAATTVSPSGNESTFSNEVEVNIAAETGGGGLVDSDDPRVNSINAKRMDSAGHGHVNRHDRHADRDQAADAVKIDAKVSSAEALTWLPIVSVRASEDEKPNTAASTIDGDLDTYWGAEGDGKWIMYEVDGMAMVSEVAIAWKQGDRRTASFTLEVSRDGHTWQEVFSGDSSGTTRGFETYAFSPVWARYVLIVGYGNSSDLWNEIAETEILGQLINPGSIEEKTVGEQTYTVQLIAQDDFTQLDNWVMDMPYPETLVVEDNVLQWDARDTFGTLWHRTEIRGPSIVEYDVQALEGKLNINGIFYGSIMDQGEERLLEVRGDGDGAPNAYRAFQNYTVTLTDSENDGTWRIRFRKNPGNNLVAEHYRKYDIDLNAYHRMTYVFEDHGSMSLYVDGVRLHQYKDKQDAYRDGYHALRIYKTLANYKNFKIYRILPDDRP
jgi:hypothetical protein